MQQIKPVIKVLFVALFLVSGFCHLIYPEIFVVIMPAYLPWHLELVYISGIIEITLASLLFLPRFTEIAGWGLILLLIAVFPANLQMALHSERYAEFNSLLLWLRLPVQGLLIWVAYWVGPNSK